MGVETTGEGPPEGASTSPGAAEPAAPADSRYRVLGEIARGGMGAILRVRDDDLGRDLAMKVVLGREGASDGSKAIEERALVRFLEEAQITGQLEHPGVVPVHEVGLDAEGRVYFTMRLVEGRNLEEVFRLERYLAHVDAVFERVFGGSAGAR